MKLGYARVSTNDQNPELQIDALMSAGCNTKKIFIDKVSGAKSHRPELERLTGQLREGDTLIVWRLDRLGRSLKDLIERMEWLNDNGVTFISLTEGMDTSTPGGKLIYQVFGALSEFERNLIIDRTKAGLAAARERGRVGGAKPKLTPKQQNRLKELYDKKEMNIGELCKMFGISKPTLYRYIEKSN